MIDPNFYTTQHIELEVAELDIDEGLKDVILTTLERYEALKAAKDEADAQLKHVHNDFAYCQELNEGLLIERDQLKAKLAEANEINRQLSAVTADVQVLQDRLTVCAAEREQYRAKLNKQGA